MSAPKFIVRGDKEFVRNVSAAERDLAKEERAALRDLAKPVQQTAKGLISPYSALTARGYRIRIRKFAVSVEQSLSKTTGQHPNYGELQMRTALEPALDREAGEIEPKMKLMIERLHATHGLK